MHQKSSEGEKTKKSSISAIRFVVRITCCRNQGILVFIKKRIEKMHPPWWNFGCSLSSSQSLKYVTVFFLRYFFTHFWRFSFFSRCRGRQVTRDRLPVGPKRAKKCRFFFRISNLSRKKLKSGKISRKNSKKLKKLKILKMGGQICPPPKLIGLIQN